MTTLELDTLAETHIRDHGGIPNFQLVPGYRHTLCTSVNEEIVHGIPGRGCCSRATCSRSTAAPRWACGTGTLRSASSSAAPRSPGPEDLELIEDTEASLWAGITALRVGESLYAVGAAVEDSLTESGARRGREYGIVEDYVGHGIGTSMHMDPQVPNYRVSRQGPQGRRRHHDLHRADGGARRPGQHRARRRVDRRHPRPVPRRALGALGGRHRAGAVRATAVDGGEARLRPLGAAFAPIDPA